MKKLFVLCLLTMLSIGCTPAYKGACSANTNGQSRPYKDNSKYSSVICTEYCSVRIPGICRDSHVEMFKAVEDAYLEQDKARCSKYGFVNGTEGMTHCLMKAHDDREAAKSKQADREAAIRQQQLQQQYNEPVYIPPRRIEIPQLQYQPMQRKQTDVSCLTDCQNAGYQYGLCQSKCSY